MARKDGAQARVAWNGERGAQAVRCFARRPPPTTMSADSSKRSNLIDVYVFRIFSRYMHVAEDV